MPDKSASTRFSSDSLTLAKNRLKPQARLEQARDFIKRLTGHQDTKCTFACFADRKELKLPPRIFFGSVTEFFSILDELNSQGYGIFITIQETLSIAREAKEIGRIRAFFADLDYQGLPENFHLEPSVIVESSPGKHHIYWLLAKSCKLITDEFKRRILPLISHYKSDSHCQDLGRVLRLPGFYHLKAQPFLTRMISATDKKYQLDQFPAIAPSSPSMTPKIADNLDPAYCLRLHDECAKVFEYIKKLKRGKRHTTLNKKAYYLGGILAAYPALHEEYRVKLHDLVASLENSGIWDFQQATHPTIDSGMEAGKSKPIILEAEEKLSKSNMFKKRFFAWMSEQGDLEWNSMKLRIELDREEIEINFLRQRFQEDYNFDVGKEAFTDVITDLAKQTSYHPVKEYLEGLPACINPDAVMLKLFEVMGVEGNPEIQLIQIKKWLIAGVARVFDPGCKVDNVLILKSPKQGIGKTSFYEALFGDFFQTAGSHKSEADEILALKQAWASEYGEIDCVFDKKSIEDLKAFLTKRTDTFRAPYAAAPLTYKRDFIFCGTTNQEQFLADKTGNRRYWVVDIHKKINIKAIEGLRDELWSAIKNLYFQGITGTKINGTPDYVDNLWWLDEQQDELARLNIQGSEQYDTWEDDVMGYMKSVRLSSITEIKKALGYTDNRATDMRIAGILKQNGMKSPGANKTSYNGVRGRYWNYEDCENIEKELQALKINEPVALVTIENEPQQSHFSDIENLQCDLSQAHGDTEKQGEILHKAGKETREEFYINIDIKRKECYENALQAFLSNQQKAIILDPYSDVEILDF